MLGYEVLIFLIFALSLFAFYNNFYYTSQLLL
jgi:hypothetical protein